MVKLQSDYDKKKDLIKQEREKNDEKHKMTMIELNFRRESELIHHNQEMERQRVRSAEIRKTQERNLTARDFKRYSR